MKLFKLTIQKNQNTYTAYLRHKNITLLAHGNTPKIAMKAMKSRLAMLEGIA